MTACGCCAHAARGILRKAKMIWGQKNREYTSYVPPIFKAPFDACPKAVDGLPLSIFKLEIASSYCFRATVHSFIKHPNS